MSEPTDDEVEALFNRALDLPTQERAAFLAAACHSDPNLRAQVESLLAIDRRTHPADALLNNPPVRRSASVSVPAPDAAEPTARGPEQVRVALVVGSGSRPTDELYPLLVRRLRIFTSLMAVPLCVLFVLYCRHVVLAIWRGESEGWGDSKAAISALAKIGIPALVSGLSAALLWLRPPASVRTLRMIELLAIGSLATILLWAMVDPDLYGALEQAPKESTQIGRAFTTRYIESFSLRWFGVIVVYGLLVPNTWRRCAAVLSLLVLSPLGLFAVWSFWVRPLESEIAVSVLLYVSFYVAVAVSIVVFAAYRIELLQRQASEARRLGQYQLRRRLGAGGMGEVYLAEHVLLRRPCALKLIRPERAGDPKNLLRFEREVQVTATLTHPNTVQIFDYGHAEDGTFYYVMEYLPGLTLEQLVSRHGPLPPGRAIHFLRQVCRALGEAHEKGLIHRDVKPANVIVCERGGLYDVVKLLDFGLVLPQAISREEKLTLEGVIAGTPAYLSPEQAGGQEDVDARSDVYSVGALAYFLLTGRPPFVGQSVVKTLAAHLYEPPAPLTRHRPDVPDDLQAVVLRCLSKEPAGRHADVQSLEAALADCRAAAEWSAREAAEWWRSDARPAGRHL